MRLPVTRLAQTVVILMALAVLIVLLILMPELAREEAASNPAIHHTDWPFFLGAWILAVPIFIALFQAHKLISFVDHGETFAQKSVKALQTIKICAIIFGILIAIAGAATIIAARITNPTDDTPPIGLVTFAFVFTSSIIATFTAVLQKLVQNAIDIKQENDSIV